jgi:hypothetical protein
MSGSLATEQFIVCIKGCRGSVRDRIVVGLRKTNERPVRGRSQLVGGVPGHRPLGHGDELRSRRDLEDLLDELLRQHRLGEWSGAGQGLGE